MGDNMRILIVDDREKSAKWMAKRLAEKKGVTAAYCGFGNSDIAESIAALRPNVILLDSWDLATTDLARGLHLAREFGERWRTSGVAAIILLTVHDDDTPASISREIRDSLQDGTVDGYLRKPAEPDRILEFIEQILHRTGSKQ